METCFVLHCNAIRRHLWPFSNVLVLTAMLLLFAGCEEKKAQPAPAPPDVDVAEVVQQDVPIYQEWVAQLNGDVNAEIVPKVQGYVLKRDYQEGTAVKKGQLLFDIDPRPFQAKVDQEKADLATAEANLSRTETDVVRDTPLAAQNAIPQKQLDNDLAAQAAAKSQVEAHKAAVEQAKLNLDWTKVYSPVDGIAGTANSQVGDLVGTSTKMTTVSTVDPIRAYFSISENAYLQNAERIAAALRGVRAQAPLSIEYIQANDVPYPIKGRIILINREVSTQTGTIQFAAEFSNPEAILRPGGFGRVHIQTGMEKGALLIPQRAVIEVQSIYQVAIVGPDNKVSFRPIKVGDKVGSNWIITEGLKPGEKVIAQGFQRAREGMPVTPKPFVEAAAAATEGK
jgi:membrane fusion protein, multidrug efflux system